VCDSGKWLIIEKLNFDQGGDLDIVLGSPMYNTTEMGNVMLKVFERFPQLLDLKGRLK
jgi:hypothetical protein